MRYYPAMLDIVDRNCVVIGGGAVGARKVKTLVECGAKVTVVSLEVTPSVDALAQEGKIVLHQRGYESHDLDKAFLVIGATDDENLNARISQDANERNLLCNIADRPQVCNFILPSIVRQKDLIIAVSTCGKSPAFAKHMRKELECQFGPEYGILLDLMGAVRKKLLAQAHAPEEHKPLFNQLIDGGLLGMLGARDEAGANILLTKVLGEGFSIQEMIGGLGDADTCVGGG